VEAKAERKTSARIQQQVASKKKAEEIKQQEIAALKNCQVNT
jgi:hypothetical protein